MKQIFAIILALALLIGCTACASRVSDSIQASSPDHSEQLLHGEKPQIPSFHPDLAAPSPSEEPQSKLQEESAPLEEPGTASVPDRDVTPPEEPEIPESSNIPETSKPETPAQVPGNRVIDPAKPMVALTFDDGPHAVYSDRILDVLEENGVVATFFEVGKNVANCPEPLSRMVELGCEIGSHSNVHKDLSKLKYDALRADLDAADQAFINAVGFAPTLLRPPYGAVNKSVKYETGRSVITWTVDTEDWQSRDTDKVVSYVKSLSSLDGEIVLLHSSYESTADAVKILVPWLIQKGYQLVTVSELMAYYYGELLQPDQFYGYTYFTTHCKTDTPISLPQEPADSEEPSSTTDTQPEQSPQDPAADAPQPVNPGTSESSQPPITPEEPVPVEQPSAQNAVIPEKPIIPSSPSL